MTFLDRYARTRGFSLGTPRQFTISPDGDRIVFMRTRAGDDPSGCLWAYDLVSRTERLVADPDGLPGRDTAVSEHERARAERMRVTTVGITGYATDSAVARAVFTVSGRVWLVDLDTTAVTPLPAHVPAIDPRLSPDGRLVAYVSEGALRLVIADGSADRALATPEAPEVTYGLAEHVAAESMGRYRGYWWAPDGMRLVVARVDNSPLATWYLSDPTDPVAAPTPIRYPAAGTANADVTLHIVDLAGGSVAVDWDRRAFEYVTAVCWDEAGLLVVVQNRAQTVLRVLAVDPDNGATTVLREDSDTAWTTIVAGVPAHTSAGALVWTADLGDTRTLLVDGHPVTPPGLQVRAVLSVDGDTVLFAAADEPTNLPLWTWTAGSGLARLTSEFGIHSGCRAGGTTVVVAHGLDRVDATVTALGAGGRRQTITNRAEHAPMLPRVTFVRAGERELRTALVYPTGHRRGSGPLPVLLDPYGGPAAQRVIASASGFTLSQWFADQGFVVVIVDGRGTPGRGPAWERTVHMNRSDAPLEDQVAALHEVAARHPDLDLARVGIRGWSYGGYLAALAVLRRPDVFHAAIAGAPVIDHRLYDTHWQERFLGHPDDHPDAYDRSSLLADAPALRRPLMLIHGLRDDNVHVAHTMRLSAALLAAGRPHTVLPLARASHMVQSEEITVALMRLQVRFLLDALGPTRGTSAGQR